MGNMGKKSFLKGAAILGIAGLLTQVLGAVFRIPIANIIGTDGMAYYSAAYTIYVFLLVFSTNGAPAAISKMTSERLAFGKYKEAHRVFKLSFIFMAVFGAVLFCIVFFGGRFIVEAMSNPGAYYALLSIAPALLLVPLMSVYRGYFQGMQEMMPTAVSQIAEQGVRVAAGIALAIALMPRGAELAAAGAAGGGSIGPIIGIIVLVIIYAANRKRIAADIAADTHTEKESAASIIKTLAMIAIPITIGVSIQPIMNLGDTIFVMERLQNAAGFITKAAEDMFGALTGFAIPVINVPMAMALSMALAIVPAVSAANSIGDRVELESNIKLGFRTAMIIGVPCSFGLMCLAEPVIRLLFPMQTESAPTAANCLFILSCGIVFLCIAQTMAGILQGIGKVSLAVYGILAGFAVKCVFTYILAGIDELNVSGAAIATLTGYIVIALVNFAAVKRSTNIKIDIRLSVVKSVVSGLIMSIFVLAVYRLCVGVLGNSITTILAVAVGACVYGIVLIKIKGITADEIEKLPKGRLLTSLLRKVKLI
ncbi:MAG: polysaccharide biosynthesis protein [Eubacteriales Family XIII. Incertae Sedis bacterium]|nr:MAG: polysaccharide biosynthesis protein [Clostridiales Family XIII bacterium]